MCGNQCPDGQICSAGQCACQPGLTLVNGQCIDTKSNPQNCGGVGIVCSGNTQNCQNGVCVGQCMNNLDQCNGACVNQDTDELHGCSCQVGCKSDEL